MRGPTIEGRIPPKLAKVQAIPVEVAVCPGPNQVAENLVTQEKNTTPVTPVNKNDP